jgi:hypothetical protein
MAVALVEKRRQWPTRRYNLLLAKWLGRLGPRHAKMMKCAVCTSFWTTLVVELLLALLSPVCGGFYFAWPVTGFIGLGFTWTVISLMNIFDPPSKR